MENALECMQKRRSTKQYQSTPLPQEVVRQIAEMGTFAASGRGQQSPIILAVTDPQARAQLSRMNNAILGGPAGFDPFYGAPVVLVVLADKTISTHVYDGSLVMGNLMLAAEALGVGSCWIHRAKEMFETAEGKAFLQKYGITGDYEGIGNCVLGYPAGEPRPTQPRKAEYIHYIK